METEDDADYADDVDDADDDAYDDAYHDISMIMMMLLLMIMIMMMMMMLSCDTSVGNTPRNPTRPGSLNSRKTICNSSREPRDTSQST